MNRTMQELLIQINLNEKAQEAINDYQLSELEYQHFKSLFYSDTQKFIEHLKNQENRELLALFLYCNMAVDIYAEYEKKQIPQYIYIDTFKDIAIWADSFYQKNYQYGIDEFYWLSLPLKLKLFKVGRLQFEPVVLNAEIEVAGIHIDKGTEMLEIHIPEGRALTEDSCMESYKEAFWFFEKHFGKEYQYGKCSSWLLSPYIMEVLESSSNIGKFQKFFHVYDVIYPYRQAEERVFGSIRSDKENYPENTSLQRKIKARVMSGYDFGIGCGICDLISIK